MSTAHYDLAARLRAASTARPVPRAAASSITQLRAPVAITLQALSGGGFALSATTPTPEAAPQNSASACGGREAAQDSPLAAVADALRAGWSATERVHGQRDGGQRAQHDTERGDAPAPRPDLPEDQR